MRLPVKELKEELKKRGQSTTGEKEELRARLKEAIELNVPIASGNEAPCHESMSGLDVTARWEMLTPNEFPVPEPENVDLSHRPPTERDATINRKYGFRETFIQVPFTENTEKMAYVCPEGTNTNRKKTQRRGSALLLGNIVPRCRSVQERLVGQIPPSLGNMALTKRAISWIGSQHSCRLLQMQTWWIRPLPT